MINKKTINKIKTENFIKKFPILFGLQHNSFTVNDWFDFKQKIQNSSEINGKVLDIEILSIKNSVFKKIVETTNGNESLKGDSVHSLFQGPLFLIGCKTDDQLDFVWNSIKSNPKLIFICCIYNKKLLNHLDLNILLKTDSSIYQTLLNSLNQKTELYTTLKSPLINHPLNLIQQNILTQLSLIK